MIEARIACLPTGEYHIWTMPGEHHDDEMTVIITEEGVRDMRATRSKYLNDQRMLQAWYNELRHNQEMISKENHDNA